MSEELNGSKCHCAACDPSTFDNQRMILCAVCGNKRCPHATDHRHPCTGSNDPGQAGSAYGPSAGLTPERKAWQAARNGKFKAALDALTGVTAPVVGPGLELAAQWHDKKAAYWHDEAARREKKYRAKAGGKKASAHTLRMWYGALAIETNHAESAIEIRKMAAAPASSPAAPVVGKDDARDAALYGVGPKVTVTRSCADCKCAKSESYKVQGDSGVDVYCTHPVVNKKRIGLDWTTPDWCPAAMSTAPASEPVTAAKHPVGQGKQCDGFALHLSREQWGVVFDGLILEIERAKARKQVNTESTSDLRVTMCADVMRMIRHASGTAPTKAEPVKGKTLNVAPDDWRIDAVEAELNDDSDESAVSNRSLAQQIVGRLAGWLVEGGYQDRVCSTCDGCGKVAAAAVPAQAGSELPRLPRLWGIARDADSPGQRGVNLSFARALTDDELRALHDAFAKKGEQQ